MGLENDRIAWARLYTEPVEEDGQDIDEAVRGIASGGGQLDTEESEEDSPS